MMKKYRAAKKKRQREYGSLSEEEKNEIQKAKHAPDTLSVQVEKMIYDYTHYQLGNHLKPKLLQLCYEREAEIINSKMEDIFKFELQRIRDTIYNLRRENDVRTNV